LLPAYFLRDGALEGWATEVSKAYEWLGFTPLVLVREIGKRQKLLTALESYLMANRGSGSFEELKPKVRALAESTLAYALAQAALKPALVQLFELAAENVERLAPEPARQTAFAKTLLGAVDAVSVEAWVQQHEESLRQLSTADEWLPAVWPLFQALVDDRLLTGMEPGGLPLQLAQGWMRGSSYRELISLASAAGATKPWGEDGRRSLTEADVLKYQERCLGLDCPLVLAAVGPFLFGTDGLAAATSAVLNNFQKSLKYGLPSKLAISAFESGLADRCVAKDVAAVIEAVGYEGSHFRPALVDYRDVVAAVLTSYPTYFSAVLDGL
jgi:hypothetical protein